MNEIKEALDEAWKCIRYHENGSGDDTLTAIVALHVIAGFIGAILLGALTPIGGWVFIGALLALIFGFIWQLCPDGDLAVGYFIAFHICSMAWVGALPIALFIGIFTFPIIIYEYKKAHKGPEKEPEAMIFQVDDNAKATKSKKRKKK